MGFVKSCAAALIAFVALTSSTLAQEQAPSSPSLVAASALVDGSVDGVVDELSRQLPTVFQTSFAADMSPEQQAQLRERLVVLPGLIRAAMEQRWVEQEPPHLPPGLQERMDEYMRGTLAGRRGELRAVRPPTRDVMAAALAERFTEPQLERIGPFLATPAGRAMSHEFAVAFVQRRAPDMNAFSPEQHAAIGEFVGSPEGEAYMDSAEWVTQTVVEQLRLNTMTHGPDLMLAFTGIMCDVLGPSCATIE
jgi:hypothetical protein